MHTPGPWRCVPTESGEYYTHQIEVAEGHIASIVGWTDIGTVCPTTAANARLIEHAPDLAAALNALLAWADKMGGWDAPCWQRAQNILARANLRHPREWRSEPQTVVDAVAPGLLQILLTELARDDSIPFGAVRQAVLRGFAAWAPRPR